MARKVFIEGESNVRTTATLPAVAKAYFLRVTSARPPDGQKRNLVEANLLAHALDHLAMRRYDQAADLLAQRYTAIEANMQGMSWGTAGFLELIGEDGNTLVGQHEKALVSNETNWVRTLACPPRGSPGGGWRAPSWDGRPAGNPLQMGKGNGSGRNPFAIAPAPDVAEVVEDPNAGGKSNWGMKGKGKGARGGKKGRKGEHLQW